MPNKKNIGIIVNIIIVTLLAAAIGILAYVTVNTVKGQPVTFGGKCIMQVETGSMEPAIHVGECVIVKKTDPHSIGTGDIIAFVSEASDIRGKTVLHRVYECRSDGTFIVKGDANPVTDVLPVREDQIVGVMTKKSGFYTWLTSFADLKKDMLLVIMLATLGMACYEVKTVMLIGKESVDEKRELLMRQAIDKEIERLKAENYQPEEKEDDQE